jgi:hypothetical protein
MTCVYTEKAAGKPRVESASTKCCVDALITVHVSLLIHVFVLLAGKEATVLYLSASKHVITMAIAPDLTSVHARKAGRVMIV